MKFDVHAILINDFETTTKKKPHPKSQTLWTIYLLILSFTKAAPALQKCNKNPHTGKN